MPKPYVYSELRRRDLPFRSMELPYPEPEEYPEDVIVWWEKGWRPNDVFFKAEYPYLGYTGFGPTAESAVADVREEIEQERDDARWRRRRLHFWRKKRRKRHRRWRTT